MLRQIEAIISFGSQQNDGVNRIRLIRQVNGLNLFYVIVALSVGIICLGFFYRTRGMFVLGIVQMAATALYFMNYLLSGFKKLDIARKLTLNVFEWHLFLVVLLTNASESPVISVIILYPLLAALVEESILFNLFIGLLQLFILLIIRFLFPGVENTILAFSNINRGVSYSLLIMGLVYFPVMGSVIMKIIFMENLRAREKQKEMLNEIGVKNKQLEVYADKLKDESQRLLAEVNIAKKIQTMVLPFQEEVNNLDNMEISFIMRTADEVGGDYYDVIKISDYTTIGIGDVTGHGLSSGIIMLMAQTAIRTIAEMRINNPKDIIMILNRVLFSNIKRIRENRNMTLLVITCKDKNYTISGQHECAIICRVDGSLEIVDTANLGFYVGLLPDIESNLNTYQFSMNQGDVLLLFSDGVTEAINEKGEQFGLDNLADMVKKYHELPTHKIKYKIIGDLYNYMGSATINDDISLVVLKQK